MKVKKTAWVLFLGFSYLWTVPLTSPSYAAPKNSSTSEPVKLVYAVYNKGFHVLDLNAQYRLADWGYTGQVRLHTIGVFGFFVHIDTYTTASGRFLNDGSLQPVSYDSSGYSRGTLRHTVLGFDHNITSVKLITPPDDPDREKISSAEMQHTIDMLSGMALLLHKVQTQNTCNGVVTLFDGVRLTTMKATTQGNVQIPEDDRNEYTGQALECDFVGQQIKGFIKDSPNLEKLRQPQIGKAWFQPVGSYGKIPVRVEFHHPKLGYILAILQKE
ncbi:DUF3108 domain-containing protein [Entomobacter blattae]|uniref:DUF3108 domain-containing protein n=1 Tax=Entomobacter blattae TaxID=2762277 RepID=A0A7H1NT03_9PROT|nr:DUF3108 domain-containing protein [Entomobacter blattae]QNT78913.1 hypothetical protein JGUZn3_16950 [Entomobacter blattae]